MEAAAGLPPAYAGFADQPFVCFGLAAMSGFPRNRTLVYGLTARRSTIELGTLINLFALMRPRWDSNPRFPA